jgi:hypothetical protein
MSAAALLASLRPAAAPPGWRIAGIPGGPWTIAYPPGWVRIHSDPHTVSAASRTNGAIIGYLNLTPRQGRETLANFGRFRVAHNSDEGQRNVRDEGSAGGVRFSGAVGSCVVDRYTTALTSYRELACLVAGRHSSVVVVGSGQLAAWNGELPLLRAAVESLRG